MEAQREQTGSGTKSAGALHDSHAAIQRVLAEVEGMARVVVSAAAPFAILGCNAAFFDLLGHWAAGSALKVLQGQTTRVDALEATMGAAATAGGCHACHVCLYTASGLPLLVRVEVQFVQGSQQDAGEEVMMMLLSITPSHITR